MVFFAVKVERFSYGEIPAMTSLPSTLTAKKSMKMTFSSDKIYYNFFSGESIDYKYLKSP